MSKLSLQSVVARRGELKADDIGGRVAIEHRRAGISFLFTAPVTRIWQLIETPPAIGSLFESLAAEFDAPPSEVEADVLEFLEKALRDGFIRVQEHRPRPASGNARRNHLFLCLAGNSWG